MRSDLLDRPEHLGRTVEETIPREVVNGGHPSVPWNLWHDHVLLARTGDPDALARLVDEYATYARSLAARMARGHEAREDLDQLALEGLVVALRRFEPERGIPFPAFATPTILGALRRHYRDHGWLVRVSRRVHEIASAQRVTVERLTAVLDREPTEREVAEALGLDVGELDEARRALRARGTRSLDSVVDDETAVGARLGCPDPGFERCEERIALRRALADLDEDERTLIGLYFFEERSQLDIASMLGVSQMQVSRLLGSIIRRLRVRTLAEDG